MKLATGSAPSCGCASESPSGLGRENVGGSNKSRLPTPLHPDRAGVGSEFLLCCRVHPLRNTSLDLFAGTGTVPDISKGVRLRGWRWAWPQFSKDSPYSHHPGSLLPCPQGVPRRSLKEITGSQCEEASYTWGQTLTDLESSSFVGSGVQESHMPDSDLFLQVDG